MIVAAVRVVGAIVRGASAESNVFASEVGNSRFEKFRESSLDLELSQEPPQELSQEPSRELGLPVLSEKDAYPDDDYSHFYYPYSEHTDSDTLSSVSVSTASSVFSDSGLNTSAVGASGARTLQALSRDPNDEGQTFLIKSLEDFRRRLVAELLRNKDNSFRISKTNRVIYFDHDDDTWYLHRFLRPNRTALHPGDTLVRVPVTSCVDMTQSEGGHVSPNVDVTVSVGHAAIAKAGVTNLVALTAGVSLAHAVSFSGAVTCHVAAGHYGQMFLRPFYYEVPRGRRVGLQYYRKVGLVEKGEWEETEAFRQLVVRAPTVECAVGRTRAVCAE